MLFSIRCNITHVHQLFLPISINCNIFHKHHLNSSYQSASGVIPPMCISCSSYQWVSVAIDKCLQVIGAWIAGAFALTWAVSPALLIRCGTASSALFSTFYRFITRLTGSLRGAVTREGVSCCAPEYSYHKLVL